MYREYVFHLGTYIPRRSSVRRWSPLWKPHQAAAHRNCAAAWVNAEAIHTDEHGGYRVIGDSNTRHASSIEGMWSLFKRGVVGSFHHVARKHLDRYRDEFEFRFNNRNNPFIFRDALKELLSAEKVEYKELVS